MTFQLYRCSDGQTVSNSKLFRAIPETLQQAEWLESCASENYIADMQDALWDMWTIYQADDGRLYSAETSFRGEHFGEIAMWVEVVAVSEEV